MNSFGQFSERESIVHRIDARLKIIFLLIFSSILVALNNSVNLIFASIGIVFLLLISRISFRQILKGAKTIISVYAFIILMYVIFSRESIFMGLISMWKFALMLFAGLVLTSTTTLSHLVAGIEWLVSPLRFLKINPRNIALMLSLTIRFIPQFFFYGRKVHDAHLSRLSDLKKPKQIGLFFVKMMNRMIISASTVSDSLEARGYDINLQTKNTK